MHCGYYVHVTPTAGPETGTAQYETAADLLKALAHPVRIAVVRALADGPRCVHELVDVAQVSQSLLSQHLRVLRGAALVRGTRRGKEIAYRLSDTHVTHIVDDAVKHALEERPSDLSRGDAAPGRGERPGPPRHDPVRPAPGRSDRDPPASDHGQGRHDLGAPGRHDLADHVHTTEARS